MYTTVQFFFIWSKTLNTLVLLQIKNWKIYVDRLAMSSYTGFINV